MLLRVSRNRSSENYDSLSVNKLLFMLEEPDYQCCNPPQHIVVVIIIT
jgi:hypothetical protein